MVQSFLVRTTEHHVAPDMSKHNVPVPLTPLIGRDQDVAAVCNFLQRADVRLLTLTGAPGVGKTRLSIHASVDLVGDFADGVCFVALASLSDPNLVVSIIAQTFGLREVGVGPLIERLHAYLR